MTNSFNKVELERWFGYNYQCWMCGKNRQDAFHHIVGRGNISSRAESSILNAAPVHNFSCHINIHGELRREENQKELLQKTMRYLLAQGYEFNNIDKLFIEKYIHFYELDL